MEGPRDAPTGGMALQKSAFAWSDLSLARRERKEGNYTGGFTENVVAGGKVNYMKNDDWASVTHGTRHLLPKNRKI